MAAGGGEEATTLEFTPTWVVATVCTVIVSISLSVERLIHFTGEYLKKKHQKPLFEALEKVKEELMLLGFISLLLTVFQDRITKICVKESLTRHLLPCNFPSESINGEGPSSSTSLHRRLLAAGGDQYCASKMRQWKSWEDEISRNNYDTEDVLKPKFTHVHQHDFIRSRFLGIGKSSAFLSWVHSFFKQFYQPISKSDYLTMRHGFIMKHSKGNPKFNFHKYMMRALEDEFKEVVGISWYMWIFVVIFLLLNINGWHTYFWAAFIPLLLVLVVGTKLEHIITQLAHEVAEKHVAMEGELVVKPSDDHFWFGRPRILLTLIYFIQFQNSFEMAFLFWIWVEYGFDSCIMEHVYFVIPRLVVGVLIQMLCCHSTLPLYAIVTQMGSNFKKVLFDEQVHAGIVDWAQRARKKQQLKAAAEGSDEINPADGSEMEIQLGRVDLKDPEPHDTRPPAAGAE
ncbi:MLO-like protein 1 isoform X2 [Diospyros lotus]|uniref:MLO-like protein 1 isoform X2 n=1 Tax=Diospyros lotus TaxID=55363 RepID=UPI00224DB2C2|nr:MLO-like protein 1 isoform X2 [Diospyros lotus]